MISKFSFHTFTLQICQRTMSTTVDHTNALTLSRFILAQKDLAANNDLSILFQSITLACKVIASAVRRAGLTGLYGLDGSTNATGDDVKKLDVLSNDIFVNALRFSTKIEVMVSEEDPEPIICEEVVGDSTFLSFASFDFTILMRVLYHTSQILYCI